MMIGKLTSSKAANTVGSSLVMSANRLMYLSMIFSWSGRYSSRELFVNSPFSPFLYSECSLPSMKTQLDGLKIFTATSTTHGLTYFGDWKIFLARSLVEAITTNLWKIETQDKGPEAHLLWYSSNLGSKDSKNGPITGQNLKRGPAIDPLYIWYAIWS
ncbi:hypothetical protein OGATHE_000711 [Ogataea polymorpha]|uniref:Uncharacterized protein n=1 Tax=Ogataea polymorpha TaxID=460523 RepID=A0A9P8PTM1_9ASCO|nr:hypothetical protein OGATHE_000711 [Ogataea polymorpha]